MKKFRGWGFGVVGVDAVLGGGFALWGGAGGADAVLGGGFSAVGADAVLGGGLPLQTGQHSGELTANCN